MAGMKIAKRKDIEPEVFREASHLKVTTRILFEAEAVDSEVEVDSATTVGSQIVVSH